MEQYDAEDMRRALRGMYTLPDLGAVTSSAISHLYVHNAWDRLPEVIDPDLRPKVMASLSDDDASFRPKGTALIGTLMLSIEDAHFLTKDFFKAEFFKANVEGREDLIDAVSAYVTPLIKPIADIKLLADINGLRREAAKARADIDAVSTSLADQLEMLKELERSMMGDEVKTGSKRPRTRQNGAEASP